MAWDKTKPSYKGSLDSSEIRNNWDALYNMLIVSHDFTTGLHTALTLPIDGLTVGTTLKMASGKMLVGYSADQDGISLLQVNGVGYFKNGVKFFDGTTQTSASPSTASIAATYATLLSPILTGTPQAPTAAQNTNTTQIATTAYYIGQAGTATPLMAGTPSVGTSYLFARQDHRHPTDTSNFSATDPSMDGIASAGDATTYARSNHVHPTDTTRAAINSPTFTGIPAAPTAALGTNTTQLATTAFVKASFDALIGAVPGTLDTLQEFAAALGNDPNFATTITNSIATKLALAGGTLTGALGITSGTVASPSIFISGDTNTGLYAPSTDTLAVTLGGISKVVFSPTGDTLQVAGSVSASGGYVFPDGRAQLKAFLGLQNQGTNVAVRNRVNFTGSYITFSDDSVNDVTTVNIGANEGVPVVNYFSGTNSQTVFILSEAPISKDYCCIHIGGTYVPKNQYSLAGTQLTFNTAPAAGTNNIEVGWVKVQAALVPNSNSITSAMLVDNISLRGVPTAPTASLGQNDLQIVNTAYLKANLDALGSMSQQNATDVSVTKIGLALGTYNAPSLYFIGDTNTGIWSPAADTLAVSVAGSESLRVTSTGSLFVGRTNFVTGSEKLSIAGNATFGTTSYTIIGDDGTNSVIGSYSNKDLIIKTNNTEVGRFTSTGKLQLNTLYSSGSVGIFTDADVNAALALGKASGVGQYNIYASGTAQNYLAGFTGIGTSNPTTLFDVSGGARIRGSLEVGDTSEFWFNSYYNGGNKFRTSGYATRILQDTSGNFSFSNTISGTADEAVSWLERFRISAAGNLLIGTTTDDGTNKLQVNGAVTVAGNLSFLGAGTRIRGDFSNTTIANRVMFQTSTVNGNTQIGIVPNGTSSLTTLQLHNSADPTNCSKIQLTIDSSLATIKADANGTGTYLPMTFFTGGSETLRLTTDKRIQADFSNTTIANRTMFQTSTANAASTVGAIPNGTGNSSSFVALNTSDSNNAGYLSVLANNTTTALISAAIGTGTYLPMAFYTGGSERMRIDTSGSVGIGGAPVNSVFKFTVNNGRSNFIANNETYSISTQYTTSAGQFYIGSTNSITPDMVFSNTYGSEVMRLTGTGNVLLTNSTGGLGYGPGAGGTVIQATSKSTAVTLNKPTGQITMNNAALAAGASVIFVFYNSLLTIFDTLIVNSMWSGVVDTASYRVEVIACGAGAARIRVTNITGVSLSEAFILNYTLIKGAIS